MNIDHNFEAWSNPNCVQFYSNSRTKPEDLYRSESALLVPIIKKVKRVLDVGCAAGGFYSILKTLNPSLEYVGVDTATKMVEAAKHIHPEGDFRKVDGKGLPFDDNSFDLVLCTGVLNHVPDYRPMIADMYRVSSLYSVIDLPRVTLEPKPESFDVEKNNMILKDRFPEHSDKLAKEATKVPYALAQFGEAYTFLVHELTPSLEALGSVGYYGKTNASVTIPVAQVCFNVILLKKGPRGNRPLKAFLDLPTEMKTSLKQMASDTGIVEVSSVEAL